MNAIYKFVMSFLAKKSGKTGITTISRATDLNVELSVKQIAQTLEKMGVDVSKIKSAKEVEKFLNINEAWIKQQAKKSPIKKKDPFEGWTPTVVKDDIGIKQRMDKIKGMSDELYGGKKPPKGNINYEKMEEKLGIKLLRNENLDELVEIEKRIKEGTFPRHQRRYDEAVALEDSKIAKDKYHIPDIIDPEDFAGGGIAGMLGERTGYKTGLKAYPKIDILQTGSTPNGLDVDVRDITYGGTGIYQGNNWFGGAEGLNVDFYKNYTDDVLGKYSKPETFQYGGLAGMLGETVRVPYIA